MATAASGGGGSGLTGRGGQFAGAAAEAGADPQQALEAAGQAAAQNGAATDARPPSGTVQARPNLPDSPNRKDGTEPPDKVTTANSQ